MTLQNLYSLSIIFRLARMVLIFLVSINGACVAIRLFHFDFSRELLIDTTFVALYAVLIIFSTDMIKNVSTKITTNEFQK